MQYRYQSHCRRFILLPIIIIAVFVVAGCAGTAGRHKALVPLSVSLNQFTNLHLTSEHKREVLMTEAAHQRIRNLIIFKIMEKNSTRYKSINKKGDPDTLKANLVFTDYDKGNAFARAMLIGLGQIHINANLVLIDANTGEVVGEFAIKKTFAWGGLYGGLTGIEGAEDGFADAVVEVLFEEK